MDVAQRGDVGCEPVNVCISRISGLSAIPISLRFDVDGRSWCLGDRVLDDSPSNGARYVCRATNGPRLGSCDGAGDLFVPAGISFGAGGSEIGAGSGPDRRDGLSCESRYPLRPVLPSLHRDVRYRSRDDVDTAVRHDHLWVCFGKLFLSCWFEILPTQEAGHRQAKSLSQIATIVSPVSKIGRTFVTTVTRRTRHRIWVLCFPSSLRPSNFFQFN